MRRALWGIGTGRVRPFIYNGGDHVAPIRPAINNHFTSLPIDISPMGSSRAVRAYIFCESVLTMKEKYQVGKARNIYASKILSK